MLFILKLFFLYIFSQNFASAATFIPIPLDQQLSESTGVIYGKYIGQSVKKLANGRVVTEAQFKVLKSAGLEQKDVVNDNNFKVMYRGGVYNNINYSISGAPKFVPNKDYLMLLYKGKYGFYLTNFTLGIYNVVENNGEYFANSVVFPEHTELSDIPISEFNQKVERYVGESLENRNDNHYGIAKRSVASVEETEPVADKKEGRGPASLEPLEDDSYGVFWVVSILALLGVFAARLQRRNR